MNVGTEAQQRIEDTAWRDARAQLVELQIDALQRQFLARADAEATWRAGSREVVQAFRALATRLPGQLEGLGVREIETALYSRIATTLRRLANHKPTKGD